MREIIIIKIQKGNRITLPKEFVEKTKLKDGQYVGYRLDQTHKSFEVIEVRVEEK